MLRESGPAGIWTRDLSIASPTPYRSATTQQNEINGNVSRCVVSPYLFYFPRKCRIENIENIFYIW